MLTDAITMEKWLFQFNKLPLPSMPKYGEDHWYQIISFNCLEASNNNDCVCGAGTVN